MPLRLSVIIPARDEGEAVTESIRSALEAGATEVIVVDGSQGHETAKAALAAGATVIAEPAHRGARLNRGAAAATGDALLFLHADTLLPADALPAIARAVSSGRSFGGFRLAFRESTPGLRFTAAMVNLRTRFSRCPWGDQAQWVTRGAFARSGGFREVPLMEDYEFAIRMKRRFGGTLLPQVVLTSGRRFLEKGLVRTTVTNWVVVLGWRLGVSEERLASWYRH